MGAQTSRRSATSPRRILVFRMSKSRHWVKAQTKSLFYRLTSSLGSSACLASIPSSDAMRGTTRRAS